MYNGASGWTTGLAFSVVGSIIGACSKLCMRKSYTILSEHPTKNISEELTDRDDDSSTLCDEEEPLFHVPQQIDLHSEQHPWSAGMKINAVMLRGMALLGMGLLNPACNVYALQFASPSILSPLGGGLTLSWIVLLSECTIGERPRQAQVFATGLIIIGEVCIAAAGDHTNVYRLTMEDIQRQYQDPLFQTYFCCMLVWILSLVSIIKCGNPRWRRFAWGMIGGSVTGNQNFIKDALAVLHGVEPGTAYPVGLFFLFMLAWLIPFSGLLLLMQCIKRYDATYSASMFTGSIVITASTMSAVHYKTFSHLSIQTWIFYPLGLFILLSGIVILATEANLRQQVKTKEVATDHPVESKEESEYGSFEVST